MMSSGLYAVGSGSGQSQCLTDDTMNAIARHSRVLTALAENCDLGGAVVVDRDVNLSSLPVVLDLCPDRFRVFEVR